MLIEHLAEDTRFAVRQMRRAPVWTLAVVLTLALGIGANTAIFSILNALVLRRLPVREPDQLVEVAAIYRNNSHFPFSFPLFQQIQQNQRVFSDLFGWSGGAYNVQIGNSIFVGTVRSVSGNYYSALGATPLLGRFISSGDASNIPGAPVAVLSYEFWQQRFGGESKVLGTTIRIEGESFTVIGVSRKWFTGMSPGEPGEIMIPLTSGHNASLANSRITVWISVAARLRPGVMAEQARSQLQSFWHDALVATAPTTAPGPRLQAWLAMRFDLNSAATGISPGIRSLFERPLKILMALVLLILLAACVNVANLMLARSEARSRDITVRLSLGAMPAHIVRQLLTETFLLSCVGTFFAFLLATWVSRLLVAMMTQPFTVPIVLDLRPDWRVFLFAAAAAIATAGLIGLAPAWRASRREPVDVLRANNRTAASGVGWLPKILIVTQIALSAVLLVGASLLLRSFEKLQTVDPGFQRDEVVEVALQRRPGAFDKLDLPNYRKQLIDEVEGLPGVRSVSFVGIEIPGGGWAETVSAGAMNSSAENSTLATLAVVSPEFFRTLGIPLAGGRNFDWSDDEHHPPVAIVDSNLVRRLHPSVGAIGIHVRFGVQPEFQQLEVVGVAHSARLVSLRSSDDPVLYVPVSQHPQYAGSGALFVRSQNPASVTREVEGKIESFGHEYARSAKTLHETSDDTLVEDRAVAVLSSIFGALALLLAGVGLFGLMSYAVTRRTREIGIRMALGSKAAAVLRLVLRESLLLSVVGVIVGVPCALAATHLFSHFLFGVEPTDPVTLMFTFSALLIVGMIAGYLPARRAATTDPMIALRHE